MTAPPMSDDAAAGLAVAVRRFGDRAGPAPDTTGICRTWLITASIGLVQTFRYVTYRRSDVSLASQLLTLSMFPLAALWAFFVLRGIRWYGIATCWKTGWGTRETVEVRAEPATPSPIPVLAA